MLYGLTPNFGDGSRRVYGLIGANKKALKLFGGGDTSDGIEESSTRPLSSGFGRSFLLFFHWRWRSSHGY
ncbi:MAG: hypothetical protein AMR96_03800 [Candidatus Adiutrix intracellularis]|nr:MAG: hypothetical protein AMR96_03800 [Candidatus Adiutrix intracellularis]